MINAPQASFPMPQSNFGIPLLDDEFDAPIEEIFDHSELSSLHVFDSMNDELAF